MNINEELVARFLKNDCSREEAEYLTAYFEAHPDAVEKYIGETEWKQFTTAEVLPSAMSDQILHRIREDTALTRPYRRFWYMAAAAAVLFLITGSILWMNNRPVQTKLADTHNTREDSYRTVVVSNTSQKDKLVILEDGSTVTLTTGSVLRYTQPFNKNQRYMTLEGKAFFKVAKDKNRPFRVVAGGLMTTALGTSFWVEARPAKKDVHVTLLTGRVMVQQDSVKGISYFKPVYLAPGQALAFDRQTHLARVSYNDSPATTKNSVAKQRAAPTNTLVFNQQPLTTVLNTLQKHCHVPIAFLEEQLSDIKFSGSYSGTDSLEDILKIVVLINDLKLERTANGFSISR